MNGIAPHLKKYFLAAALAVPLAFAVSLGFLIFGQNGRRYIFIFPSAERGHVRRAEFRLLSPMQGKSAVAQYVDELLLGPLSEGCAPLFPPGTSALSCFVRSSTLFVDVSEEALLCAPIGTDFRAIIALFEENVRRNFPYIKEVDFFIAGRAAFEAAQ